MRRRQREGHRPALLDTLGDPRRSTTQPAPLRRHRSCCPYLNNYMVFNDVDGVYSYSFEYERKADCLACSNKPRTVEARPDQALTTLVTSLVDRCVCVCVCVCVSCLGWGQN